MTGPWATWGVLAFSLPLHFTRIRSLYQLGFRRVTYFHHHKLKKTTTTTTNKQTKNEENIYYQIAACIGKMTKSTNHSLQFFS